MPRATLYSIPGSHPAMSVQRMLELKGISYKRVDLMPVISRAALKLMRFPGVTIPALKIDGRRITGSLEISRVLDEIQPSPPLFPDDPTSARRGRGRRALGKRGPPGRRPANPLERDQARQGAAGHLRRGSAARVADRSRREDRRADHRHGGEDQQGRRRDRPGRSRRLPRLVAPGRRLDRGRDARRRSAQRGRPPGRDRAAPRDDARGSAALHRGTTRRRPGDAPDPGFPRQRAEDPPRALARAARRRRSPRPSAGPKRLDVLARAESLERVLQPCCRPAVVSSGSSSSSGTRTKRAARHLAVRQAQPLVLELDLAQQQQVDVDRPGPMAQGAEVAPHLGLDRLAGIEQLQRLERGGDAGGAR